MHVPVLERAISEIVRRHEVLRARFVEDDGEPWQIAGEPVPLTLEVEELKTEDEAMRVVDEEARRHFDLAADSMLRVRLLRVSELDHVLVIVIHHIACDGWSLGIMMQDLGKFYSAFKNNTIAELEAPNSFTEYAIDEWCRVFGRN